jgi:hypothetical protein
LAKGHVTAGGDDLPIEVDDERLRERIELDEDRRHRVLRRLKRL